MTANRRIFLNIIATYGRSLYALILGLFTARWALHALGQVDYGLYGVIGGMTVFIAYFNGILGASIGRFYAVSVGNLDECQKWFTTAVVIHTLIPIMLISIGYPIGIWAVRNFLTIPADRIATCVWVWRFVSTSCLVGMMSIPFTAMYTAKQYIAEMTVYSFVSTTCNALFLYYMITHPGMWLAKYALWQCIVAVIPQIIIAFRAICIFPECRIRSRFLRCGRNIKVLSGYALWNAWGALGGVLREQGDAVLVNKFFGPNVNASFAIGSNVSGQANTLSSSLIGAFSPAIFNLWGRGEYDKARELGYRASKFGTLFVLLFAIPLSIEIDSVLTIWLKNPPRYAAGFCLFVLVMSVIDKLSDGQRIVVNANGKIAIYQMFLGTSMVLTMPLAWMLILLGCGVYSVGVAMVVTMCFCSLGRVWLARGLVRMSFIRWCTDVFMPLLASSLVTSIAGVIVKRFMEPSLFRILVVTIVCELMFLSATWIVVFSKEEREFFLRRIRK